MASSHVHRVATWACLLGFVGLLAFVGHTIVPDSGAVAWFFDYPVYYGLVGLAMLLTAARAALVPLHRAGWIALALGVLSYGSAEFVYQFYVLPHGDPYPSIADALYLAFYPCSYVGLILLFRARAAEVTAGVWIDGITAALAASAVGSAILVQAVLDTTEGSLSVVATNIAYPMGDVVLLSFVVAAFALTNWQPGRAWLLIGASLAVFAIADAIYLYATANGTYVEGSLLDASWPAALLFIAFAGWQDDGHGGRIDARGRTFLAVPAVCGTLAIAVLVLDHFQRVNLVALVLATAVLLGVLVRLALSFRENGRLLELTHRDAITDPLTGLGNRRRLLRDLDRVVADSSSERPWLLVIFDLDGFKAYNDAFGHPAGDALLARLGQKLSEVSGGSGGSGAYRLGGDEFCLLAPAVAEDAEAIVDRAAAALEESGEGFVVSSSFGAVFVPLDAQDASDALRQADQRLYAQKHVRRTRRERPHEVLLQALYERDPELQTHLEDVTRLSVTIGRELGLSERALDELHRAAQLHDIGKIAIPDAILHKPEPLSDEDWAFIRQHTVIGERILGASPALRAIAPVIRASHERWDGSGYPDALSGVEIPLAARIIAVCDALAAMTAPRPYRKPLDTESAIAELERCSGTQFDPSIVTLAVQVVQGGASVGTVRV